MVCPEENVMKTQMSNYRAVALAEGFEDGDEEEVIEAWQYEV